MDQESRSTKGFWKRLKAKFYFSEALTMLVWRAIVLSVVLLGLFCWSTGPHGILVLLGAPVGWLSLPDTWSTAASLIISGKMWFPTFALDRSALRPNHVFVLIGTAAVFASILERVPQKIYVSPTATVPSALPLPQITTHWGEARNLFLSWGRTLSLGAYSVTQPSQGTQQQRSLRS